MDRAAPRSSRTGALRGTVAALIAFALWLAPSRAAAGDPYLRWYTITTPHFRVTYHSGLEASAQRTASLAESIHARLTPHLAWQPRERTEIVLTDDTDSANGSATAVPYDLVRMYASAPDDMSALGDYEDWQLGLLTHEYTHVLHLDNIGGLPAIVNSILGKTWAPNQLQPRWIIEGLAVAFESDHTSAGRVRGTQFDMYLRADVLEHRLATLDQMSHPARRWPSGNLWYLYGGKFIDFIARTYGPDTFAAVATDYGENPIPWGINRSIRRVTGRTYPELYTAWKAALERQYGAQLAAVRARGLREGKRLTHFGRVVGYPRFVPECARTGAREEIVLYKDDGHTTAGFWRVPLASRERADEGDASLVTRSQGRVASPDGHCGWVFDAIAPSQRYYYFGDLFRQPAGTSAPRGIERSRQRLTTGLRARDPDVSPDGRRLAYVTNARGTSTLRLATLVSGALTDTRRLVPSAHDEQAFTPRWSPDGKQIAYSAWTRGGYRDVRVVDVGTGRFENVTHDRALDQQPVWSRDGRWLYFVSDRTGIANVYARETDSGRLFQVTNVQTGAYMPEPSPDGRTLFYVGYTSAGFDLYSLPLDRGRFLPAPDATDDRPENLSEPRARRWQVEEYSSLRTIRPRRYQVDLTTGAFGNQLVVSTAASDLVGRHGVSLVVAADFDRAEPVGSLGYVYAGLPFALRMGVSRSAAPRKGYRYGDQEPIYTERFTGLTTGVSFGYPGEFDGQSLSLSYTAGKFDALLPVGPADPYSQITRDPHRGFLALTRLGWGYSNVDGTTYGISAERGFAVGAGVDWGDPAIGSQHTLTAVSARAVGYVPLPWARHHVLAAAVSGGASGGTYPRRGLYFTGGYNPTLPVLDAFTSGIQQSGFVLRGYEPAQFIGTSYNLFNLEYRFPIAYVDHGVSTLPAFFRTLSGAAFFDYGGAYDSLDLKKPFDSYHGSIGAELWFDLVLGYYVSGTLRFGYAKRLEGDLPGEALSGQTYFVASAPF